MDLRTNCEFPRRILRWDFPGIRFSPVSISFEQPIHGVNDVDVVRHAVLELAAKSMERRKDRELLHQRSGHPAGSDQSPLS